MSVASPIRSNNYKELFYLIFRVGEKIKHLVQLQYITTKERHCAGRHHNSSRRNRALPPYRIAMTNARR